MQNVNIHDLCQLVGEKTNQRRTFSFAPAYAERGYSNAKGILFGNWNPVCGFGVLKEVQRRDPVSKLARVAEALGFECEWEDEWSTCCDCGNAVRTEPDSYGWTPYYRIVNECDLVCLDCLGKDKEDYLESIEDDPTKACPPEWNPVELGYVKFNGTFETGFHPGQNDNPAKILKAMQEQGLEHIIFRIKSQGQFDLNWEAYYKPEPEA